MRKLVAFIWLLLPVGAAAYHYGPGQDLLASDRAALAQERGVQRARLACEVAARDGDLAATTHWAAAEAAFTEAIEALPEDAVARGRALRLERAKAWMFLSKLPEARSELESLVRDLAQDPLVEPAQLRDARSALANAQYYTTWLMRLEGAGREVWEPEVESARQNFAWCADQAARAGDEGGERTAREDVESAVRLARMDLGELQGLPLPSQ